MPSAQIEKGNRVEDTTCSQNRKGDLTPIEDRPQEGDLMT